MTGLLTLTSQAQLRVGRLRCQHLVNPLGVEDSRPRLSWELNSDQQNVRQAFYRLWVAEDSMQVLQGKGMVWDSKRINSQSSIQIQYNGQRLQAARKYFWKVQVWDNQGHTAVSDISHWQMGLLTEADWFPAKWIAFENLPDSQRIVPAEHGSGKKEWGKRPDICPLFRKDFGVSKKLQQASVFISGLGQFELSINGTKAGDHFLDPGWTKYDAQAQYVSFDITAFLREGSNTASVILGNGFYYIPGERYRKMTGAYGYPKMIAKILLRYQDGSISVIGTNEEWKTIASPISFSSIYGGENYDATHEQPGWDRPGFDDRLWKNAILTSSHPLIAQTAAPVKRMEAFIPIREQSISQRTTVYDLGQNMSGIPEIMINARWGDSIRITCGELLKEDGTVNQRATGSPSYFQYIARNGDASWSPRFSYTGFRYMQVDILPVDPDRLPQIKRILAWHTRNSADSVGQFYCSNELFNQTNRLIRWAIKSNMQSVFTDCPHRERLGWQEQLHLMGNALQHNYDIHALGKKIMADIRAEQNSNGLIPSTVPEYTQMHFADGYFRDSPEWGSNVILFPWNLYQWYGDKEELSKTYPHMQRYLDYLHSRDSVYLLMYGLSDWYDLGPQRPGFCQLTPMGLTATAYYYYDLVIMQQIANLLGKKADAARYATWAAKVKTAFNRMFFNSTTKQYGTGSQTSIAMTLSMDLVEPSNRTAVLNNLVKHIQEGDYRLTSGDIGFHHLLSVLHRYKMDEIVYKMNNRSDVPGYGYQLTKGATALTESWQGLPVVSNNHFMLGHLMDWFYTGLVGISQQKGSVAYQQLLIRPVPTGDIKKAGATYHTAYGELKVDWRIDKGIFELELLIPVNCTALVYLPGQSTPKQIGSGRYRFNTKWTQ